MSDNHTSGPWSCDDFGVITGGEHGMTSVAETYQSKWRHTFTAAANSRDPLLAELVQQAKNDGQLIAAAPDLLAALRDMVDMFERHIDGRPGPDDAAMRWDAARDAIAKATGQVNA